MENHIKNTIEKHKSFTLLHREKAESRGGPISQLLA